jgi:putative sigma-54 modulation protein
MPELSHQRRTCCAAISKGVAITKKQAHSEIGSSPALRSYVTGKLDRITRHFDQLVDIKVLLSVEKQKEKDGRQRAECNIHVKGNDMFAESTHEDLYAAVDDLVDKLDRQVVRHKDRIKNHHHEAPKRLM